MAHLKYNEINNENYTESLSNWCSLVNNNENTCRNFSSKDWFLFFYYCLWKVRLSALPSFHPYWHYVVYFKERERLNEMYNKNTLIQKDPSLRKILYSKNTNQKEIEIIISQQKVTVEKYKANSFLCLIIKIIIIYQRKIKILN